MASKEATVYILDLGASTARCHNGRNESDLDFGMRYVWEKIAITLSNNRATDLLGVLGVRTDATSHQLDLEEYPNITILKPLEPIRMSHLRELQRDITPSNTNEGDAISALVVAIDHMQKGTSTKAGKPGKFKRTIVLLTDGQGYMDCDGLDSIASQIRDVEIELKVVGIDFDDKEYGFKEEEKSEIKKTNERALQDLVDQCDGTYGTVAAAVEQHRSMPDVKTTRPYSSFKGKLKLGDCEKYHATALWIDVHRYFKTKMRKPDSASTIYERSTNGRASGASSHTIGEDLGMADVPGLKGDLAVKNDVVYTVVVEDDPSAIDGKKIVERDELARGYSYGRTAVAISDSESNVTKLETFTELSIIGFIPSDKYERYLNMGESCITVAEPTNDKARMALSSLIHSLQGLDSYAIGRLVRPLSKDNPLGKDPEIILLAPFVERDMEALVDVPLPFAEDVRMYRFPPLDRVITTSGAVLTSHRNIPDNDLVHAMSKYVDSMDISNFGRDDDGKPAEYMAIEDTYSPVVHYLNQVIRRRATHPDEEAEKPTGIVVKYARPPSDLVKKASPRLKTLVEAAGVKKVEAKVKGRRGRQLKEPKSGLNIDDLLKSTGRDKIDKDNAIAEFKQILYQSDGSDNPASLIHDAGKQMTDIIHGLIRQSPHGPASGKLDVQALENIKVMRHEMIEYDEPKFYNNFIKPLKTDLLAGNLCERKRAIAIWHDIKKANLGLIDNVTSPGISDTTPEEALEFFKASEGGLPTRSR